MKTTKLKFWRSLLAPVLAMMVAALAGCDTGNIFNDDNASGNATATEAFSFSVQVAGQNRIELHGVNGNVELVGVPQAQTVQVWGERRVTSRSIADARDYLTHLEVRVIDSHDQILVETVQPDDNHGRELEADYHLRVPAAWLATLQNGNGNVTVDSLTQAVTIALTNGNIVSKKISGRLTASLTNGNVGLYQITEDVGVALVNGNINATVLLPPQGTCNLNTVNGTIDLQIPRDASAEFSAALANGTISLADLVLQNAVSSRTSMRGKLGEGAGKISLQTVNGDIRVRGF